MKIECSVEELKELIKNSELKEKTIEIKINGEKIKKEKLITPIINWGI